MNMDTNQSHSKLKKKRKYEPEWKIRERFIKYRKGKKIRKDDLYYARKAKGQKNLKMKKWFSQKK